MKKFAFWIGIGALALTSCSNDELVTGTNYEGGANTPINFAASAGNMTRAAGSTQLSEVHWDFGVWAYKNTNPEGLVMKNYLVGYWDRSNNLGYEPTNEQELYGSSIGSYVWYYQGLGNKEGKTSWTDAEGNEITKAYYDFHEASGKEAATAYNPYQYLKYWDRAATKTMFYAYAPYKLDVQYVNTTHTMTFPKISSITGAGENAMYAVKEQTNPTDENNSYVELDFKRLLAKVRVGFYEVVPGYTVELIPYGNVDIPAEDPWNGFGKSAMFAVPANTDDEITYTKGSYVTSATPKVVFSGETANVTYEYADDGSSLSQDNINIPLYFYTKDDRSTANKLTLGTSQNDAIVNDTKDVLPSGTEYCGFTLNLSLKFTAIDSGEEIYVRNVRVHIPKEHCQWEANHLYTYYFKVTKTVPGSPAVPNEPGVDPGEDPYLLPIVFDNVTIEDIVDEQHEYPVLDE